MHQLVMLMDTDRMALINIGLRVINGTLLSISSYQWSVAEYTAINAWLYNGFNGIVNYISKYGSNSVRPVLASNA